MGVTAIADDPDASATLEAAVFHDERKKVKAAFKFQSKEARRAVENIEEHRRKLEQKEFADYQRV